MVLALGDFADLAGLAKHNLQSSLVDLSRRSNNLRL